MSLLFLPEAWDPWERQHTSPAHYGCIVLAKGEVVVSKMCTTGYWLWSRLFSICECCTSMKNCRDSAFSLWVGREAVSLSAADVRNMWRSAKQNLSDMLRHVCCRNPFQSFLFGVPSIHSLPEAWGSWEPQYVPQALLSACIMPIPSLQLKEKTCPMQRGFGHGVVVLKICYNILIVVPCDCCRGGASLSVAHVSKMWCSAKRDLWDMFVGGIHSCHSLLEFQASNPYQKLEVPENAACLTSSAFLHYAHPFVAEKTSHMQSNRGFWSRSCGLQDLLRTIQWLSPRFGLHGIDCALSCDTANEWTIVEIDKIEVLASVGWKWGCHSFSCPCSLNVTHCRKESSSACFISGIHSDHSLQGHSTH